MNNELQTVCTSPFDSIRQTEGSQEFWSARDLQDLLGYALWQNFEKTIKKAMAACKNVGQDPEANFIDANKVTSKGKHGNYTVTDYHLTRYACYLTAMNGDPEKEEIAQAQTYFALKTYEAERQLLPRVQSRYQEAMTIFQSCGYVSFVWPLEVRRPISHFPMATTLAMVTVGKEPFSQLSMQTKRIVSF